MRASTKRLLDKVVVALRAVDRLLGGWNAKARRRRVAGAFLAMVAVVVFGTAKIEFQQTKIQHLAMKANQLARSVKHDQAALTRNQAALARETAARRQQRTGQINAIDRAVERSCAGSHKLSVAVSQILRISLDETTVPLEEAQIAALVGHPLTGGEEAAVVAAVEKSRDELDRAIMLAKGADCTATSTPKPQPTRKGAKQP